MQQLAIITRDTAAPDWVQPRAREFLTTPLPDLDLLDRALLRGIATLGASRVNSISGAHRIAVDCDPFILAVNHSTRLEALFLPAFLILLRGGRRIHFLADWNFRMIPGMDLIYRRSGAITVPNKPARPRFLGVLKPLFTDRVAPMVKARHVLASGCSVGVFPEGTVNSHPTRLLRGRLGTARLSIAAGVPVVPVGLRFASTMPNARIAEGAPMDIVIGEAMHPPTGVTLDCSAAVRDWHARIMAAIGGLSGKSPRLPHTGEAR